MGYYRNLMIDMRKQLGAALDAKGLVVRGRDHGNLMEFSFVTDGDESFGSMVRLIVNGPEITGRGEATWADVEMVAAEVTVEKIGMDWTVYNVTDDYMEEHEGSDDEFIEMINAHLVEFEAVPLTREWRPGILSWSASNAFNAMHSIVTGYGLPADGIAFERDDIQETLVCVDGDGKEFRFICPFGCGSQFFVNGKLEETSDDRGNMLLAVLRRFIPPEGHREHYIPYS